MQNVYSPELILRSQGLFKLLYILCSAEVLEDCDCVRATALSKSELIRASRE